VEDGRNLGGKRSIADVCPYRALTMRSRASREQEEHFPNKTGMNWLWKERNKEHDNTRKIPGVSKAVSRANEAEGGNLSYYGGPWGQTRANWPRKV